MNCRDARAGFPAFSRGGMSLTEFALLEAHVRQCADCRKERESVEAALNCRPQVTPRVPLPRLSKMTDVIRLAATSFAGRLSRRRVVLSISLTGARLASARVIEASRVGARWLVGLLARMGWLLSTLFKLSARAVAPVIDATAFAMMWFADLLARVRVSLTIAVRDAAQATIETARVGATRLVKRCAHLQISLRSSVATALPEAMRGAIEGARAGVTRVLDVVLLVRGLLPVAVNLYQRVAGKVSVATRFARARLGDLLARPRVLLAILLRVSVATAAWVTAASRVGPIRDLNPLTRARWLPMFLSTMAERAAVKGIGATWVVGRVVVTSGRTLSLPGLSAWTSASRRWGRNRITSERMWHKVAAARTRIASLAILVTALGFLWAFQWPDNLMLWPDPADGDAPSIAPAAG
jgi:hypothetical protein